MVVVVLLLLLISSTHLVSCETETDTSSTSTSYSSSSSHHQQHACQAFKVPNDRTSQVLVDEYRTHDETLFAYIASNIPQVLDHTGSTAFDEHLRGVQAVLRGWNAPVHLTYAGLFHSIYGTEGFQGFTLPLTERNVIQELIGNEAERLCFIFCMVDRYTVDQTIFAWNNKTKTLHPDDDDDDDNNNNHTETTSSRFATFRARPELGRFDMHLSKDEWLDLVELSLADWLEQVEGAAMTSSDRFCWDGPSEAYAYRRTAYRRMVDILITERSDRLATIVPNDVRRGHVPRNCHLPNTWYKNGRRPCPRRPRMPWMRYVLRE